MELWDVEEVVTVCPEGRDMWENLWLWEIPGECLEDAAAAAVGARSRSFDFRPDIKEDPEEGFEEVLYELGVTRVADP